MVTVSGFNRVVKGMFFSQGVTLQISRRNLLFIVGRYSCVFLRRSDLCIIQIHVAHKGGGSGPNGQRESYVYIFPHPALK